MLLQQLIGKDLVSDNDLDWIPVGEGIRRKIMAYNDAMMLVKVAFEKGRIGAQHFHPHLQMTYVASGAFEVTIDRPSPTSLFISVDFPTFGFPIIPTKPALCSIIYIHYISIVKERIISLQTKI